MIVVHLALFFATIANGQEVVTFPAVLTTPRSIGDHVMAVADSIALDTNLEVWKPVVGFLGYEVSNTGKVRSYWKRGPAKQSLGTVPRILTPGRHEYGYEKYTLVRDGRKHYTQVHILVLEAFIGPRPDGYVACHGPAGPLCNNVENLSWGTQSKNCLEDKRRDGTAQIGEKHGCAKLTEADVREIRRLYRSGVKQTELAIRFGHKQGHISDICLGKIWSHIPLEGGT